MVRSLWYTLLLVDAAVAVVSSRAGGLQMLDSPVGAVSVPQCALSIVISNLECGSGGCPSFCNDDAILSRMRYGILLECRDCHDLELVHQAAEKICKKEMSGFASLMEAGGYSCTTSTSTASVSGPAISLPPQITSGLSSTLGVYSMASESSKSPRTTPEVTTVPEKPSTTAPSDGSEVTSAGTNNAPIVGPGYGAGTSQSYRIVGIFEFCGLVLAMLTVELLFSLL